MTEKTAREAAVMLAEKILDEKEYSHTALHGFLDRASWMNRQDRAFLSRIVTGTVERRLFLDYAIDQVSKVKTQKMKPFIRAVLRTAAYQVFFMDGVADRVPLVGSVAAGSPILAEENVEEYLAFDTGGRTGEYFALKVRGESMLYAGILPGDLVIVHRQENFRNGDIVVALFEDEATVKTYSMEKGHLWLLPENPDYQPIDGEGCSLLGKVAAVLRRYN